MTLPKSSLLLPNFMFDDFIIKTLWDYENVQSGRGKSEETEFERGDKLYSVFDVFYQEFDTLEDDPREKTGSVSPEGVRDVGTSSLSGAVSFRIPSEERNKLSSNEGAV